MIRTAFGAERVTIFVALRVADKVIERPRVRGRVTLGNATLSESVAFARDQRSLT
jgi:hypothetical protein